MNERHLIGRVEDMTAIAELLTPEQAAAVAACAGGREYLAVEGVWSDDYEWADPHVVPPPEWVALADYCSSWVGSFCVDDDPLSGGPPEGCHCIDGRPRHQLTVECPQVCTACLRPRFNWDSQCHCGWTSSGLPVLTSPTLTVDVVVTGVLPVLHRPSGPEPGDGPMVYLFGGYWWLCLDENHYESIRSVIGDVRPGWFVVVLDVEARP